MQEKHCIIINTSMLAGLTDATRDSSSCKSFALGVFFFFSYFHQHLQEKEVPESMDILKPLPRRFFV